MKNLLFFAALGVLAYFAYQKWSGGAPTPETQPAPTPAVTPAPARSDFFIRSRAEKLLTEWKRRALSGGSGERGAAATDMAHEITEIRRRLMDRGQHSREDVASAVLQALRELGVAEDEIKEVTAGILQQAASDGQKPARSGVRQQKQ